MRHLEQNARAVARVRLTSARAAMIEVHQNRQRLLDDFVRALALHLADKADAARVVLKLWIVESLFFRRAVVGHCSCS